MPPSSDNGLNFWEQLMAIAAVDSVPTREQLVSSLGSLAAFYGLLLLGLGIGCLLYGRRSYKTIVVLDAIALGALVGAMLGGLMVRQTGQQNTQAISAIAGGLLLGVMAFPLMKSGVAVMGALSGAFMGYGLWLYVAGLTQSQSLESHAWAGAVIGLIALGLLSMVVFDETIMIFPALEGSVLVVSGSVVLLMKFGAFRNGLQDNLVNNVHVMPLLLIVPAGIGLAYQIAEEIKNKKKKAAAGG